MKPNRCQSLSLVLASFALFAATAGRAATNPTPIDAGVTSPDCVAQGVTPLSPALDTLASSLGAPMSKPESPKVKIGLPDGTAIVLTNVKLKDTLPVQEEIRLHPEVAPVIDKLARSPESQAAELEDIINEDSSALSGLGQQSYSEARRRFTNNGILGPAGRWPGPAGQCTTITGRATVYGVGEKLKPLTASGAHFSPDKLAIAHRTLPIGATVEIKNAKTDKTVSGVVVNDRGPAIETGNLADMTRATAQAIGVTGRYASATVEIRCCH